MTRMFIAATMLFVASLAQAAGLGGHDPVSYFGPDGAVKGASAISATHKGETYYFANEKNRATFTASPEKYLPQYGGHCAWAVAQGNLAPTDPTVFKVVDGKLYLNFNRDVATRWERDIPGFIRSADSRWPSLAPK